MDTARWRRIEEVFDGALAVAPTERAGWVAAACDGDDELAREVTSLLASDPGATEVIRDAVAREVSETGVEARLPVGRRLGPYRLGKVLGAGGMGVVYLAHRADSTFAKQVAIKVLPHAFGTPHALARFRDERQILAALEHRNIVRLLDGGSTDDGLPYLVMEHVDGQPITAFARGRALSVRARVELVREVCAGLQYAHSNLIVHRDIKPANVLVDSAGTPKVLDFGIAKLLAPVSGFGREAQTRTGQVMFTAEYASPEQARGEPVSTATDVYSLGAVLYELLTDQPPQRPTGSVVEVVRAICEVEPARPSAVAPAERRRELAGDLDNILLKALHRDPAQRYATIDHLADDLGRFLAAEPVHARVATVSYRLGKFVCRHRAAVIATALIAAALVSATVISVAQARRADGQARRADHAAAAAQAEADRAQAEAERARRAEAQVQAQLDLIHAEKSGRAAAEDQARQKTSEVEMTREQLRAALARAQEEKRIAQEESRRALTAEARAEQAARAERSTRLEAEALYEREKARREQLEARNKQITTRLR